MIRLRIVGIFYDEKFPVASIRNIKDLLDAAQSVVGGGFNYVPLAGATGMGIKSFSNTLPVGLNPTLGSNGRIKGKYTISYKKAEQDEGDCVFSRVWQYYVISEGRSVSNCYGGDPLKNAVSPPSLPKGLSGFTRFDQMPVRDRDEVVWRNVSIAQVPGK